MESSRQDLLNDVAEHRSILKNNQNTYYPRFSFTPNIGIAFPKTGFLFLLCCAPGNARIGNTRGLEVTALPIPVLPNYSRKLEFQ